MLHTILFYRFIDPVGVFPILATLVPALVCVHFLARLFHLEPSKAKFASVDGLRGFLAFFVFLHHASIIYFCLKAGKWAAPPSKLYIHFGQSTVALFFMITSFLFISKLIEGKQKPIDWLQLFVSRFLRLYPLYFFAFLILIFYAGYFSDFVLKEKGTQVVSRALHWLAFAILQAPDINGFKDTANVFLGVLWSIKYEWIFYLSLPFVGLVFFRLKVPFWILFFTTLAIAFVFFNTSGLRVIYFFAFSGGICAAFLCRSEKFCRLAGKPLSAVFVILPLVFLLFFFSTAFDFLPLLLLSVSFIFIAGGNSLFGLLTNRLSRLFAKLSYGIYLFHGVFLFTATKVLFPTEKIAAFSVVEYWLFVSAIGFSVIVFCFVLHVCVEKPALAKTNKLTAALRNLLNKSHKQI